MGNKGSRADDGGGDDEKKGFDFFSRYGEEADEQAVRRRSDIPSSRLRKLKEERKSSKLTPAELEAQRRSVRKSKRAVLRGLISSGGKSKRGSDGVEAGSGRRRMGYEDDEDKNQNKRKPLWEESSEEEDDEHDQAAEEVFADDLDDAVYEEDFPVSREKWMCVWGFIKVLTFVGFMAAGFYISTNDYNKRTCVTGTLGASGNTFCLFYNKTMECVGVDDSLCVTACGSSPFAEGCRVDKVNNVYTCYLDEVSFLTDCKDQQTCLDNEEKDLGNTVLLISVLFLFLVLTNLVVASGLFHFSAYHASDFRKDLTRSQAILFQCAKVGPYLLQILWGILMLICIYLLILNYTASSDCSNAITNTGGKFEFPSDALNFTLAAISTAVAFFIVGSVMRHKVRVRGYLFRPSEEKDIRIPFNLDCYETRTDNPPRCFTEDQAKKCRRELCFCKMCHWCPMCFAWSVECVCAPILSCGQLLGWTYKHRHFLGP